MTRSKTQLNVNRAHSAGRANPFCAARGESLSCSTIYIYRVQDVFVRSRSRESPTRPANDDGFAFFFWNHSWESCRDRDPSCIDRHPFTLVRPCRKVFPCILRPGCLRTWFRLFATWLYFDTIEELIAGSYFLAGPPTRENPDQPLKFLLEFPSNSSGDVELVLDCYSNGIGEFASLSEKFLFFKYIAFPR